MILKLKPTKNKVKSCYKSLYLSNELAENLNKIAVENNTSFNNVVVSIIEEFIEKQSEIKKEGS